MQQQVMEPQFKVQGGHLVMYHQDQTGLPQVKDATVNDRDRMQDLLAQEKYLTQSYNIAMQEASHDALFNVIKQNFDDVHQLQRQLFNTMFKKGWYKLPVADAASVAYTAEQWKQYKVQFPFSSQKQGTTAASQHGQTVQHTQTTQPVTAGYQPAQTVHHTQPAPATKTDGSADQMVRQAAQQAIQEASQGKTPHVLTGQKTH